MTELPKLLRGTRLRHACALGANGIGQAMAAAFIAWGTRAVFDRTMGGAALTLPFLTLAAAGAALAWFRFRERVDAEKLGQHYAIEIREQLFHHLLRLRARDVSTRSRGGTLLKFVGDLTAIRLWVSLGIAPLWVAGATLTGAFVALASLSCNIATAVCAPIAVGAVCIALSGSKLRDAAREARRRRARLTGDVAERLNSLAVVQAFGQSYREWRRVKRRGRSLRDAMVDRAVVIGRVRGLAELTTAGATVATLWFGTRAVSQGELTAGTVVAAIAVVGVLAPAFKGLSRTFEYWNSAKISRDVILRFLAEPTVDSLHRDETVIQMIDTAVEFDNVTINGSLKDVSFRIPANLVTALVGANGSGKSTILATIGGAAHPDKGEVLIGGVPSRSMSIGRIRQLCGWVSPDLPLLKGTLRRNLKYGDPRISDEILLERMRKYNLLALTRLSADGLDQRISESGSNLSVGQRQLVALARTLVLEPKMLLLDEFDANLDPAHRSLAARSIAEFIGTVVMVTHHLETLHWTDHVVHVHAGEIVSFGPREAVIGSASTVTELFGDGTRVR